MALNGTLELIQTVTVPAGGQSAIEFTNVPQTFDDLYIVSSLRGTGGSWDGFYVYFNGSNTNLSSRYLLGDGSGPGTSTIAGGYAGTVNWNGAVAGTFSNSSLYIPNYRTSAFKGYSVDNIAENNTTPAYINIIAGLWSSTSAISTVTLYPGSGIFMENSTAYLYGVKRTLQSVKATGGAIYQDATYWYHAFGASGIFTPTQSLTADVLVVAGGGGGGHGNGGGGGGAGGVVALTSQALTATNYTITIGGGGAVSADGVNSSFASTTALKGGRGGDAGANGAGGSGTYGSGGGCGRDGGQFGGAGTAGQGFAGGNSAYPTPDANGGSGGGGAGGAGNNVITTDNENRLSPNGDGGIGTNAYASWLAASGFGVGGYIAGGGGGSAFQTLRAPAGGLGGGGRGTMANTGSQGATPGLANSGSGGGGGGTGSFKSAGQPGGSGLVIIRYAK